MTKQMKPPSDMELKKKCFVCEKSVPIFECDSHMLILCEMCADKLIKEYSRNKELYPASETDINSVL